MSDSPDRYRPRSFLKRVATALVFVVYAVVNLEPLSRLPSWWREGFSFETVAESLGTLYREGLVAPVLGEDGEIVRRGGRVVWQATESGQGMAEENSRQERAELG